MDNSNKIPGRLLVLVIPFLLAYSPSIFSQQNFNSDVLLFPFIETEINQNPDTSSLLKHNDFDAGVDLFATLEWRRFRFLGEYLVSRNEQHLERAQIGWTINDNHRVWLGRFHNPVGYWNTNYHHGDYLETTVSRPAIVEFEDFKGIIPIHLGGILYEGLTEFSDHGLGYSVAIAAGPDFKNHLNAWDITSPGSGKRDIATTLNIYYEPELYHPTRYGIFISYNEIPAEFVGFDEIQQTIYGLYGNWQPNRWHILGSLFYIQNDLEMSAGSIDESILAGYIQVGYEILPEWTVFGRFEDTWGEDNDRYIELFPDYVEGRKLGGVRFDFADNNTLKLELSDREATSGNTIQIKLQWSAFF